jgi:diacylglycerol kinase family enzyme
MYLYIYDDFVQDPKLEREVSLVETRLTDLGISGRIARLALFRDAKELIYDEVRSGEITTIVALGNDGTFRKVLDAASDYGIALAIIPIGSSNHHVSSILGFPASVEACDVLSARIIEELDVGEIDGRRFIGTATIKTFSQSTIQMDGMYQIVTPGQGTIEARNLELSDAEVRAANPVTGRLDLAIRPSSKGWFSRTRHEASIIPFRHAHIRSNKPMVISVDGKENEAMETTINIFPQRLRVVIGKERKF